MCCQEQGSDLPEARLPTVKIKKRKRRKERQIRKPQAMAVGFFSSWKRGFESAAVDGLCKRLGGAHPPATCLQELE